MSQSFSKCGTLLPDFSPPGPYKLRNSKNACICRIRKRKLRMWSSLTLASHMKFQWITNSSAHPTWFSHILKSTRGLHRSEDHSAATMGAKDWLGWSDTWCLVTMELHSSIKLFLVSISQRKCKCSPHRYIDSLMLLNKLKQAWFIFVLEIFKVHISLVIYQRQMHSLHAIDVVPPVKSNEMCDSPDVHVS